MIEVAELVALEGALRAEGAAGADRALSRGERRRLGAFFSPLPLVNYVVRTTLDHWYRGQSDAACLLELRVLDPACGDGRFLQAAGAWIRSKLLGAGLRVPAGLRERALCGIERDPRFAKTAATNTGGRIVNAEALLSPEAAEVRADVVVGNPPYLRAVALLDSDPDLCSALRGRFAATSYGEWDLYGAFIERTLEWMEDGGEACLVVPSRWHTASFARELRSKLADSKQLRALVDFGHQQVFDGVSTYASLVYLSKLDGGEVEVARHRRGTWSVGTVAQSSLDGRPGA